MVALALKFVRAYFSYSIYVYLFFNTKHAIQEYILINIYLYFNSHKKNILYSGQNIDEKIQITIQQDAMMKKNKMQETVSVHID